VRFEPTRGGASEQIARELRRYLLAHDLRPGDRLGTEQELAEEFGVSRPTLREALRLLAGSHLLRASTGPGGGIFVASTPNEGIRRNLSDSIASMLEADAVSLRELVDARLFLEVPLAGLAAENATERTAAELQDAIDAAAGHHPAAPAFRAADTRFHQAIAAAAGNELLRGFTGWTLDVLQPSLVDTLGERIDAASILDQHRAIRVAVARRRPAAARRAMREHLEYMRELVRAHELAG
jgi:DNA-binding FadR family transcriptional regulator